MQTSDTSFRPDTLADTIRDTLTDNKLVDSAIAGEICKYLSSECSDTLKSRTIPLNALRAFWPPRFISAIRRGEAAIFFGAGLSIPCKIPGWWDLLRGFKIDQALIDDDTLKHDPLTLAELVSKQTGQENLQQLLRQKSGNVDTFSTTHILLSALRCPVYITTNYDCIFEQAWQRVNHGKIEVVVNDADLSKQTVKKALEEKTGVLFKIHGSADRKEEQLILTLRDYRTHYRFNNDFFAKIKELMGGHKVLFVGFSHTDPEIARLVEDIIYDFEHDSNRTAPHFFSLQFDMRSHTPEIFAARGIVALQPPPAPAIAAIDDIRTQALAYSLSDLITRKCHEGDPETWFYNDIESIRQEFETDIRAALEVLEKYHDKSLAFLARRDAENGDWVQELQIELGQFASQGVYLLDEQGIVREYATPNVLPKALRKLETHQKTLRERPYFRQAKSFREAFVSDCAESKFNKHSTVFFCKPITAGEFMKGLLFSACQIGQWSKPIDIAERYWAKEAKEISFLLIDSNGVCLLPPNNEFPPKDRQETKNGVSSAPGANIGYEYSKLLSLSLRDSLISHIGSSVVPVSLDDDVKAYSANYSQFSVISEIKSSHWKIALSVPVVRP